MMKRSLGQKKILLFFRYFLKVDNKSQGVLFVENVEKKSTVNPPYCTELYNSIFSVHSLCPPPPLIYCKVI
jgi:hypothetical protein